MAWQKFASRGRRTRLSFTTTRALFCLAKALCAKSHFRFHAKIREPDFTPTGHGDRRPAAFSMRALRARGAAKAPDRSTRFAGARRASCLTTIAPDHNAAAMILADAGRLDQTFQQAFADAPPYMDHVVGLLRCAGARGRSSWLRLPGWMNRSYMIFKYPQAC